MNEPSVDTSAASINPEVVTVSAKRDAEITPTSAPTLTQPVLVKRKSGKTKLVLLGCVLFSCIICFAVFALTFAAYTSNQNIPVFSDVVEKLERTVVTDKQIGEIVTGEVAKQLDTLKGKDISELEYDTPYKSFAYDLKLDAVIQLPTEDDMELHLTGNGIYNARNSSPIMSLNLLSEFKTTGLSLTPTLNFRSFGEKEDLVAYLQLGQIPTTVIPTAKQINDKWIEFDMSKILDEIGVDSYEELLKSTTAQSSKLKDSDIDKLKQIVQDEELVNSFKRLPDEIIDGVRNTCVSINFDDASLKRYVTNINKIDNQKSSTLSTSDVQINTLEMVSCAGRQDKLIYKVTFKLDIESDKSGSGVITVSMNFKNFDKDLQVEEPDADLDYMDLIQQFYSTPTYDSYINGSLPLSL